MDYWESKLRLEASSLDSVTYFKPEVHSLLYPPPIFSTAGQTPTKSPRPSPHGFCLASTLAQVPESLEHILFHCPFYQPSRSKLGATWKLTGLVLGQLAELGANFASLRPLFDRMNIIDLFQNCILF